MPRPSIWRLGASPLLGELGPEQLPEQLTAGKTALVAFFRRIHPRRPCSATSRVPFHRGVCRRPALCCLRRPTETSRSGGDTNGSPMTGRWWLFAPPPSRELLHLSRRCSILGGRVVVQRAWVPGHGSQPPQMASGSTAGRRFTPGSGFLRRRRRPVGATALPLLAVSSVAVCVTVQVLGVANPEWPQAMYKTPARRGGRRNEQTQGRGLQREGEKRPQHLSDRRSQLS